MKKIDDYRTVAPPGTVDKLVRMAARVRGRKFLHVNSTRKGGGVAEILQQMLPLMQDLGLVCDWQVIEGDEFFFKTTKAFHNGLQGSEVEITDDMFEHYLAVNRKNAARLNFDYDFILIHDPQPAPLIEKRSGQKWVWRCHIDLSTPYRKAWHRLRDIVAQYDGAVYSLAKFSRKMPIPEYLVFPSIDPLSDKNRPLEKEEVDAVLAKLQIPTDLPLVVQVSRFDRFKDPVGVIRAFALVKRYVPCRLILAGGTASDDPEGEQVFQEVTAEAEEVGDVHVLMLPPDAHVEINALQRAATVVVQKSLREGFGLTVSEAMWKGKPVVGGFTGGITQQVIFGKTGYTVNSVQGCAFRLRQLLTRPDEARQMGIWAKEWVRQNFLITRHIADYIAIMIQHCSAS